MQFEPKSEDVLPETVTFEEAQAILESRKQSIRRKSLWAVGIGAVLIIVSVSAVIFVDLFLRPDLAGTIDPDTGIFELLFQNILFLIGILTLVGGFVGLWHSKRLTLSDYVASPEAITFLSEIQYHRPTYTYIFVGGIVAVFIAQTVSDASLASAGVKITSIKLAGLVKDEVWNNQWWRLMTAGMLHGGILHIYFNSQAFLGLGKMMEALSEKAHVAIVFMLSVLGGSILSTLLLPKGISVGASGGIMGLLGYLSVYGYRRRQHLPPDFLRNILVNVIFIGALGIVLWNIVDNYGHLGGLLVGAIYALFQIPKDPNKDPREIGPIVDGLGLLSVGIFIVTCVLLILLFSGQIEFVS